MRHLSRFLVVSFAVVAVGITAAHAAEGGRPLVGVNYFGGWDEGPHSRWKSPSWRPDRPDWRPLFPDRVPLVGSVTDQATMDREIKAAADHGVDFFSILWYLAGRESKPPSPADTAVRLFLASPQAHRLRFMIEYCNHAGLSAETDNEWAACVAAWTEAMKHPSALRVGGRLVFKIHSTVEYLAANGGDVERCKKQLAALRKAVADAGLGEVIIGGGTMSRSGIGPKHPAVQLFDFTATYMTVPNIPAESQAESADADLPFAKLAAEARFGRQFHAKDPVPWVPYLAVGWNPRPWTHKGVAEHLRTFFAFPSREEWTAELEAMKDDFELYPSLGLPLPDGGTQKAFTIYAWNEFGEGGFLAPTAADQSMKLEAIRDVFGGPPAAGDCTGTTVRAGRTDRRPNIVLMLADDLGYGDTGCYDAPDARTPNMDRLAGRAVRFTDAYAAFPVCSPSRAALLTGRFVHRFGPAFEDYFGGGSPGLAPDRHPTLPQMLHATGYATGCFGKWNVSNSGRIPANAFGFDRWVGLHLNHDYFTHRLERGDDRPLFFRHRRVNVRREQFDIQQVAVRQGNWKYLRSDRFLGDERCGEPSDEALYDLPADVGETTNLADVRPAELARLRAVFERWESDVDGHAPGGP